MITKKIYYDENTRITKVYVFGCLVYKKVDEAFAFERAVG